VLNFPHYDYDFHSACEPVTSVRARFGRRPRRTYTGSRRRHHQTQRYLLLVRRGSLARQRSLQSVTSHVIRRTTWPIGRFAIRWSRLPIPNISRGTGCSSAQRCFIISKPASMSCMPTLTRGLQVCQGRRIHLRLPSMAITSISKASVRLARKAATSASSSTTTALPNLIFEKPPDEGLLHCEAFSRLSRCRKGGEFHSFPARGWSSCSLRGTLLHHRVPSERLGSQSEHVLHRAGPGRGHGPRSRTSRLARRTPTASQIDHDAQGHGLERRPP